MANENAKQGAAIAAGSLIGTATALFLAGQAKPVQAAGTVGLDQAAMSALLAIAQESQNLESIASSGQLSTTLLNQIAQILGAPGAGVGNPNTFKAFELRPSAASSPVQFPPFPVPYNMSVVIKARNGNLGTVYVAPSEGETQNSSSRFYLLQNETISYKVDNTNRIWLIVDNASDGVAVTLEMRGV